MAGLFGLSVDSCGREFFREKFHWGTSYNRHLGMHWSGLASVNTSGVITSESKPGDFASSFKGGMDRFINGCEAISYCGVFPEPFHVKRSKLGSFALCFNGNITNCQRMIRELESSDHLFERGDSIEVLAKLIVQGDDFVDGIKKMAARVEGAYSLLVLTRQGIYAVCCPTGHWPLVIGVHRKLKAAIVSSEHTGFYNMEFDIKRNIKPGEIILLKYGDWTSIAQLQGAEKQECSFYGVYTSFPGDIVHGKPAAETRKRLGASLARRDIEQGLTPHIILPVPDSGRFHALGYKGEFDNEVNRQINSGRITLKWVPYLDESLIKYGFTRSFLGLTKREREERAHYKIVITGETINHFIKMLREAGLTHIADDILKNQRIIIVICEDSVVRGVQVKSNLAPKLRYIYEKKVDGCEIKVEIHVRASYPELLSHCPFGTTTKKGETLAESCVTIEERVEFLGVDSLGYNTIDDLVKILEVSKENLCLDCALPGQ